MIDSPFTFFLFSCFRAFLHAKLVDDNDRQPARRSRTGDHQRGAGQAEWTHWLFLPSGDE